MKKTELPIPVYKLALLQSYLYQVFSLENLCKKDFRNTEWYLHENHTDDEIKLIIDFLKDMGLKCDCDIIKKFDLRELSEGIIKSHN